MVLMLFCGERADSVSAQQQKSASGEPTVAITAANLTAFQDRLKQYTKLHEEAVKKLPKPSSESKPDKIEAYQEGLAELIRTARTNAKPGEIFTPDMAVHVRGVIRDEFKGERRRELRENVLEANPKSGALRVNYSYPETKELTDMPPTLLLKLPELPKQLRYYFAGRRLLLLDREAQIVIDYVADALP